MSKLLIRGGTIVDGTGAPPYESDIAVEDGRIVAIGRGLTVSGGQIIDAVGLMVCPGFIDIHSHTDSTIFHHPMADSKLLQGVTTEVVGNCGIGAFPVHPDRKDVLVQYLTVHGNAFPPEGIPWLDFSSYARYLERRGIGVNLAPLVSHGTLRIAVMGADDRKPSEAEQAGMNRQLELALQQGAWGLSTGLIYPPGSFADTEELIELARVVAAHHSLFASHIRGESGSLLTAVEEMIHIARASGARVEVSHLKAIGQPNWGRGKEALAAILDAHRAGVNIGADQYPYEASSTSLTALVPPWAHDGGVEALLQRLTTEDMRAALQHGIEQEMTVRGGPEHVIIASTGTNQHKQLWGKNLAEIAALWQCSPADAVIRLLAAEKAAVSAVYFSLSPDDVRAIVSCPEVAVGSDGSGLCAQQDANTAIHPRSYGTFPRVLGKYVREEKLLSWEAGIYKMTGLPAARLGFKDRGVLKVGLAADITVFDPQTIRDRADFVRPHQYPAGIVYVIVNGKVTVSDGKLTGIAAGQVLRKD